MDIGAQGEFQTPGRIVQADVRLDGHMALTVGIDNGGGGDSGGGVGSPDREGEQEDAENQCDESAHGITSKNA